MKSYINRLKEIDFCRCAYKTVDVCSLDYLGRRTLFTELYKNCNAAESDRLHQCKPDSFYFLKMPASGDNIVITYLNQNIASNVTYSADLTITELPSPRGTRRLSSAIRKCKDLSIYHMETAAGTMQIFHSPIRLRTEIEYDKLYDGEWNPPTCTLTEYCNRTTYFYVIGTILSKTEPSGIPL